MEYAEGSCCCRKVIFKVALPASFGAHCHCTQCQRLHGAAFATWIGFKTNDFEVIDPEKVFAIFNTGLADRGFCRNCGSSFYFKYVDSNGKVGKEWLDFVYFALTNFTKGPDLLPDHNIEFETHVPWLEDVLDLPK